jgi:soluble lytic murein transglycosylase-like protein
MMQSEPNRFDELRRRCMLTLLGSSALVLPHRAHAGAQVYEPLADAVRNALAAQIADTRPPVRNFDTHEGRMAFVDWLDAMSDRLRARKADDLMRLDFLRTLDYEATRAGLDRQMVLGLIQVESAFRKYAISNAGARGYMQVMPFWVRQIGNEGHDLFTLRTNLRYGCTILRFYLDVEKGDLYRALGRYNGSLGRPEYPNGVLATMQRHWSWKASTAADAEGATDQLRATALR